MRFLNMDDNKITEDENNSSPDENIPPESSADSDAEKNILSVNNDDEKPNQITENMEVHHHPHVQHSKKWKNYLYEFLMLFLAVSAGFFVENLREHHIENERLKQYLKSMQLDIESNVIALDYVMNENSKMIESYDKLIALLAKNEPTIDRASFARNLGEVWVRSFINRNETFEQMKSSGTLRYLKNFHLLTTILDYQRKCNFAQWRSQGFEVKYYTDIFIPALYNNYDMACLFMLDTTYSHNPEIRLNNLKHVDVLSGEEAVKFRKEVGSAFMLRLERLHVTIAAYKTAKEKGLELAKLLEKHLE